ncbi:19006_t:CDS:2 [Funneliformis geosporum]|uniref:19006_t:CDS:1 n=1 Tax=Funneliformis geosporum TaxID=1117311 RepID=A0A9W4SDL1_9GLOM|nr:19006_t:CDS:2 [Funneliformis geosporum]
MVRNIIDIIKAVDTSGLFSVIEKLFEILSYMDVDCYHVAIYLGNKKVVHIGSSKFVKSSKIKDNKSLLGARTDNWVDFLHGTDKLIRYHPIIPFQRPSKIQKHITKSVLAKYGAESYSFLGNNCEHFATLVVCGIPFSIQADKISLSVHKFHWDLAKEMLKNKQEFAKMSNSEKFAEELTKNKEQHVKEINNLKTKTELYEEEQYQLIQLTKLEAELENLEKLIKKLQDQTNINDTNSEIELRSISHYGRTASSLSSNNQALVINKVFLYALRLFEYKDNKLTELERYAKNKVGYPTLENKNQVIELADTAGIENFYTITQYLTRTIPVIGAGLAIEGDTQTGAIIAGVSLYADYLISRGKEKLFKSEQKKEKLSEFNKDAENIYDRYQELAEILKPLRSDSREELNKLLKILQQELREITKVAAKSELSRLFISFRDGNEFEYKQGIANNEIEESIKNRMLELEVIQKDKDNTSEFEKGPLVSTFNNNSSTQLLEIKDTLSTASQSTNVFRKRTISNSKENESTNREVHELVDLQIQEELQSHQEIPPK